MEVWIWNPAGGIMPSLLIIRLICRNFSSVQFEGSISGDYRICFKDNAGTFFITSPEKPDEWNYPSAFDGKGEWNLMAPGYAYFLILGTKGSEGPTVNFNLTSITLKGGGEAPNNTDGVTEGE